MPQQCKKILDERLLMSLASGISADAAAQSVGMNKRTVYRRLTDPDFRRRLIELRADLAMRTSAMLTAASTALVKTLLAPGKEATP
jgi:signal transduction protein with GAF and PtsI domain